jgi:hypothetical protein
MKYGVPSERSSQTQKRLAFCKTICDTVFMVRNNLSFFLLNHF